MKSILIVKVDHSRVFARFLVEAIAIEFVVIDGRVGGGGGGGRRDRIVPLERARPSSDFGSRAQHVLALVVGAASHPPQTILALELRCVLAAQMHSFVTTTVCFVRTQTEQFDSFTLALQNKT